MSAPTFPPEHHALRDLETTAQVLRPGHAVSVAPLFDAVRDRAGHVSLGVLSAVVDGSAGAAALMLAQPDWTATADLNLHRSDGPVPQGPVVTTSRLERMGTRLIVMRTTVHDALGEEPDHIIDGLVADPDAPVPYPLVAIGLLTFMRVPAARSVMAGAFDAATFYERRHLGPPVRNELPVRDRLGLLSVDGSPGTVDLTMTPYVHNSRQALTGGVYGMLFEEAARAACPGLTTTDLEIHYLAGARDTTVRTTATPLRHRADHAHCTVDTIEMASSAAVCTGSVTLGRL